MALTETRRDTGKGTDGIELALPGGPLRLALAEGFDAIRADWLALERRAGLGAFQGVAWAEAHWASGVAGPKARLALVAGRDAAGRLVLVLPLAVVREGLARVAHLLSNPHAAHRAPAVAPELAARLDAVAARRVAEAATRLARADLLLMEQQPATLHGRKNPWATGPRRVMHADMVSEASLGDCWATFEAAHRSARSRSEERRRETVLARDHGVVFEMPFEPAARLALLDEIVSRRAAWLRARGFTPIDDAAGLAFLRRLALAEGPEGYVARLSVLRIDGEFAAGSLCVVQAGRQDAILLGIGEGAWGRYTPGQLLLTRLLRHATSTGITRFGFGVGENELKARWTDRRIAIFSAALPVNALGRLAALAALARWNAKDLVKRSPRLYRPLLRLRARLGHLADVLGGRAATRLTQTAPAARPIASIEAAGPVTSTLPTSRAA